jgi:hypothetical protein
VTVLWVLRHCKFGSIAVFRPLKSGHHPVILLIQPLYL